MNYPDFLVIGAPKCGTSWLHEVLESHPEVFIPPQRKEIHYFDRYIGKKPISWYLSFFNEARKSMVCGEITPSYLYLQDFRVFERIKSLKHFVVILRDPVERCISHYRFRARIDNYRGSFQEFLSNYPSALERGFYGKCLESFLEVYSREQLLVLFQEDAARSPQKITRLLADFLELDLTGFDTKALFVTPNKSFQPRNPLVYRCGVIVSNFLLRGELYSLRNILRKKVGRLLVAGSPERDDMISQVERQWLKQFYSDDEKLLKRLLEVTSLPWERATSS